MIRSRLSAAEYDDLQLQAGVYYPLKSILPNEIVANIVDIIRTELQWWKNLRRRDLAQLYSTAMCLEPRNMTSHTMRFFLKQTLSFDSAKAAYDILQKCTIYNISFEHFKQFRELRNRFLRENVKKYGFQFILFASNAIVASDLRYMSSKHSFSVPNHWYRDKQLMIKAYIKMTCPTVDPEVCMLPRHQ